MKTFQQFKDELGVKNIAFQVGKGRAFATVKDKNIVVGKDTSVTKPLFVIESLVDADGVVRNTPLYILVNSNVKEAFVL